MPFKRKGRAVVTYEVTDNRGRIGPSLLVPMLRLCYSEREKRNLYSSKGCGRESGYGVILLMNSI